eukprot:m.224826 g.224826  ORF g.224826 m.224826 type:complete len:63 (+) comp18777_c0_seq6:1359-1547(+)
MHVMTSSFRSVVSKRPRTSDPRGLLKDCDGKAGISQATGNDEASGTCSNHCSPLRCCHCSQC